MSRGKTILSQQITRLRALCGMLSAATDGERATAAMMATRHLKTMGLTWAELVDRAFEVPQQQPQVGPRYDGPRPKQSNRLREYQGITSANAMQVMMAWIDEAELLTDRDREFIRGAQKQRAGSVGFTRRQWDWVIDILIRIQRRAQQSA